MATARLLIALERGDVRGMTAALASGANLADKDDVGWQPIHRAALYGRGAPLTCLLDHRACVDASSDRGQPIHAGAAAGHVAAVSLLLERRALPGACDDDDQQPIHLAALSGHRGVVSLLLDRSAEVHARSSSGQQAIHSAAHAGQSEVLSLLLDRAASIDETDVENGNEPIHIAAMAGQPRVTALLLARTAQVGARGPSDLQPLHLATRCGHRDVVFLLLDHGASVNAQAKYGTEPEDAVSSCERDQPRQKECLSLLGDMKKVAKWRAEGLRQLGRGLDIVATEELGKARAHSEELGLKRLAAELAAEASECELRMDHFEECSRLCRIALSVKPPLVSAGALKDRLRDALRGIQGGKSKLAEEPVKEEPVKEPVVQEPVDPGGLQKTPTAEGKGDPVQLLATAEVMRAEDGASPEGATEEQEEQGDEEVKEGDHAAIQELLERGLKTLEASDEAVDEALRGVNLDGLEVESSEAELQRERDEAVAAAQRQATELAQLRTRLLEVEGRCEQLARERDAFAEVAEQQQRLADERGEKLRQLRQLCPNLELAVQEVNKILQDTSKHLQ